MAINKAVPFPTVGTSINAPHLCKVKKAPHRHVIWKKHLHLKS